MLCMNKIIIKSPASHPETDFEHFVYTYNYYFLCMMSLYMYKCIICMN